MKTAFRNNIALLSLGLIAGCWLTPSVNAAATDITDIPLPVTSSVAPNLMFMVDNSGSMGNIVPDSPFNSSTTYTTCPAANVFSGGAATVLGARTPTNSFTLAVTVSDGSLWINDGSAWYRFGTGAGQKCFDPALYYDMGLNADTNSGGYNYSWNYSSIYSGNYLNWYLSDTTNHNIADTFSNGTRKTGTQTRLEIAKTAAKSVIAGLSKVRVGLFSYTLNDGGRLYEVMGDLDAAKRTAMNTAIDNLTASNWTPLAETLSDIGRYYATGYTGNLTLHPGGTSSSVSVASTFNNHTYTNLSGVTTPPAPIQYWCQKSFAILMTDGLPTQDQNISADLQEYYGYCTANPGSCSGGFGKRTGEYYETSNSSDYLDDVANALYDIDLRPDLAPPSPATKTNKNNVLTYTIGFADPMLTTTTLLSRAALYGGGLSMMATNASSLVSAFQQAADDILAKDGSAAAVAVANAHVTNTDNASYATSYNSGNWTGDVIAYPINTSTGIPDIMSPIWNTGCASPAAWVDPGDHSKGVLGCSAQVLLDARTTASRYIFTNNDTSSCRANCGIPFQPTTAGGASGVDKLSTAQQTRLNTPSQTDGAAVVDYLRGDRTGETTTYRSRAHLLGDTIDSEPLVVREPDQNYIDSGYSSFKSTNANRQRLVIQAANDGMVHAFNALSGAEEWAYVPNMLITDVNDPNNASTSILNTRTAKTNFNHYFLIDGTPVSGDADFNNTQGASGTADWHTIVVGGFGKGGRGYYALDVTTPTATSEANAALKALWEFPRSIVNATQRASATQNIGYTFGKPIITKTTAAGWVVLVTSGYNNGTTTGGDGYGHLYVINAKTGDLIADLVTPQCRTDVTASAANSQANPCGLTFINGYVESRDINNLVEYVYAGDLYGNVWSFNLTGSTVASWSVTKLAVLRSGANSTDPVQPITTVPELAKININNVDRYFVYVGTGQYLGKSDLPCPPSPATCAWTPNAQSTQTQTMYGLVDPRTGTTLPDPLRGSLVAQTFTTSGTTRTFSNNTINFTNKKGWYVDFTGGERIITDPALAAGALVFTSNIPNTTPCMPGGSSWIYAIDYQTGGQISGATWGGQFLSSALASRPVLVQLPDGSIKALVRLSDATTVTKGIPIPATASGGKRVSWRELLDN